MDLSSTHSVFLVEGGYVFTMGRNSEGQRGLGHCSTVESPTLVDFIRDRFITVRLPKLYYLATEYKLNVAKLIFARLGIDEKLKNK